MSKQTIWHVVADLKNPNAEPFAVLRVDTSVSSGDGVEGTVISLHWSHDEAERRARELDEERAWPGGPFFLTQWEREDYERQKRGEKPLGPPGASALSPADGK